MGTFQCVSGARKVDAVFAKIAEALRFVPF